MLYEVALILEPSKKEKEDGEKEKLIFGPVSLIAKDEQTAGIKTILKAKDEGLLTCNFDQVKVLVRPFV